MGKKRRKSEANKGSKSNSPSKKLITKKQKPTLDITVTILNGNVTFKGFTIPFEELHKDPEKFSITFQGGNKIKSDKLKWINEAFEAQRPKQEKGKPSILNAIKFDFPPNSNSGQLLCHPAFSEIIKQVFKDKPSGIVIEKIINLPPTRITKFAEYFVFHKEG